MHRVTLISGGLGLGLALTVLGCSKQLKGIDANAGAPQASASAGSAHSSAHKPLASSNPPAPPGSAARESSMPISPEGSGRLDEIALSDEANALFERELLVARKLMAQNQYAKAIEHFTRALGTGRPDAQALGERGYAHYLLKDKVAAKSDFWNAAGSAAPEKVQAQIWYNLGLVYEDENDSEMSRVAFAMSYAMGKSRAAKTKLGGRSACRSAIVFGPAAKDEVGAVVVKGWLGVHQEFRLDGTPKSEAEAKNIVCHTVSRAMGGPPEDPDGVCTEASPWELSCCAGAGGFIFRQMFVVEGKRGAFFTYDAGSAGGWPRQCQGYPMRTVALQGDNVLVTTVGSYLASNDDYVSAHAKLDDLLEAPCRQSPEMTHVEIFSLTSGKRRLKVTSYSTSTPPTITLNDAGTEVTLRGNDCDVTTKL